MYQDHKNALCIRPLSSSDLPVLYSILSQAETSRLLHWSPTLAELEDAYLRFWKDDPDERNYLLSLDGVVVGWLKLNGFCGNDLWVSMLVIQTEYRGCQLGRQALDFAEATAHQNGFHRLNVQTTVDNLTAVALYLKYGFDLIAYVAQDQRYRFQKELG